MNKECPICYEELDATKITLMCNHTFHYDCIVKTFMKNNNNRTCPYCRLNVDFIELRNNYPIQGIHKEFNIIEKYINLNDFQKVKELTHKYLNPNKCKEIIKTGPKKGYQCKKNKKKNLNYCHLHNS